MNPFNGTTPDPEWFRLTRLEKRIPQTVVAKAVGVNRSTIASFERGNTILLSNVLKYAEVLGYKVSIELKEKS